MKKEHIADIIYSHIAGNRKEAGKSAASIPATARPAKKIFLSDWEIKKLYNKQKKEVVVPCNAIISPLSMDWLEYNGVKIIRQP